MKRIIFSFFLVCLTNTYGFGQSTKPINKLQLIKERGGVNRNDSIPNINDGTKKIKSKRAG